MKERVQYALKVLRQLRRRNDWGSRFNANDLREAAIVHQKHEVLLDRLAGFFAGFGVEWPVADMADRVLEYLTRAEVIDWDKVQCDGYVFTQKEHSRGPRHSAVEGTDGNDGSPTPRDRYEIGY